MNERLLKQLKGGLIVSCQALPDEPLHGPQYMARMARAAFEGGAVGIRANGAEDIAAIRETVPLPVIGLLKQVYADSPVFITPTVREAETVIRAGADLVAIDATTRPRPGGAVLADIFAHVHAHWGTPIVADVSSPHEALTAVEAGADIVATTLIGYTDEGVEPPPYEPPMEKIGAIIEAVRPMPVIAEGRIWSPEDARRCIEMGAIAVVVGSAITRPQLITARFVGGIGGAATHELGPR